MDRQPVLEGDRLILRPLQPADWDALYGVASDPELWALHPMHDRWQEPVFRAFFDDALAQGGALAVILRGSGRETGRIIGSSRFQGYSADVGGEVEIGWTFLAREFWGGSYNAEMKRLMLGHALAQVGCVLFRVGIDNLRSRGAMEKIGGKLRPGVERIDTPHGEVVHVIYEIRREDFGGGPLG